jgi:glyoxylate/hydroxypyruvate reductase A
VERPALLYNSPIDDPAPWKKAFAERRPDLDFRVWPDIGDATHIRYALIWSIESGFLDSLPNLEAIFSMGAGVDQICATRNSRSESRCSGWSMPASRSR